MNEIEREVSIEQVDYNIDINDNNYTIEIDSPSEYIIELNEQGPQGLRGYTGNGISSFELTSSSGLVDTYTVTFTDGETTTINVTNGNGISSIAKTSTVGLEDEYTITFDNGDTETFTVTNGEKGDTGNGIASISLTSTSGLVDTYTITFTNGDTTTFDVTNGEEGNGISSINKTSTSGLVDTYTITFTNGDTETFTVTNGKDGQDGTAATISVGSTTTGNPGTSASVTNSGTSSAAVLDFVIPQGVKGETGATGADGFSPTATVTKSGDTATITITDKNGTTTATVSDGSGASSISQLTDVDLTGLSNGDVLVYDSTSQEWKAEAQSGGGVDLTAGTDLEIVSIGSQGLPNGYTLLEWVESSGLQSLSLGFSGNCTFEFTTQMAHVPTNNEVLLTSSTGASAGTWFGVNSDNTWSYSEISGSTKIDVVMNATAQGLNGTINGNAFSRNVPVSHGTWTLFNNIPASGAATFPSSMKLFALKVTQNSAVIRNLIPCKNNNNVVGLYDTINSVFYSSTSGTQLIAGTVIPTGKVINFTNESGYTKNVGTVTSVNGVQPDSNGNVTLVTGGVTDVEVNGESVVTDSVAEIDLTGYQKKLTAGTDLEIVEGSTLPSGYTELTSITSTGTQWINTGVKLTNNFKSIIVGRLTGTPAGNFRTILGAVNGNLSTGKQNVLIGWGTSSNGFYTEVCSSQPTYIYSSYPWDTNTHTFTTIVTPTATTLNIDGVINTVNSTPSITGVNLAIFARLSQNNTVNSQIKFELNSIELYQSNVLVFKGIPAQRNADGEIGLYEAVSGTFFPNSGTGTFTAGSVVPNLTVINFTNDSGFITGIDSTDVTTALGYTPYNATNPNGYTSNVGTVTSVNGTQPDGNGNVAITIPTVNNGTLTITQDGNTLGTFGANQSGNTTVDIPSGGSSRNIGEIVASTIPLTDAGLHLLDGALISGSGSYSAFVDYIAGLVADYPDLFDTEANWQSAVTQYGVCGKFVYTPQKYAFIYPGDNSTGWYCNSLEVGANFYTASGSRLSTIASISGNHITISDSYLFPLGFDRDTANDVELSVRLPKITGIVEGTTNVTALGDLVQAGLPNITGMLRTIGAGNAGLYLSGSTGAFSNPSDTISGQLANTTGGTTYRNANFDASLSNPIYGNSSTVQPQTIIVLYYIVVATSTKTNIEVDIDEIATDLNGKADKDEIAADLNGKADKDLSNVTNTGYIKMAGASMPSSIYTDLTLGSSGTGYRAPANGWYTICSSSNGTYPKSIELINSSGGDVNMSVTAYNNNKSGWLRCSLPVKKGDIVACYYNNISLQHFRFVYAQGSESEA